MFFLIELRKDEGSLFPLLLPSYKKTVACSWASWYRESKFEVLDSIRTFWWNVLFVDEYTYFTCVLTMATARNSIFLHYLLGEDIKWSIVNDNILSKIKLLQKILFMIILDCFNRILLLHVLSMVKTCLTKNFIDLEWSLLLVHIDMNIIPGAAAALHFTSVNTTMIHCKPEPPRCTWIHTSMFIEQLAVYSLWLLAIKKNI